MIKMCKHINKNDSISSIASKVNVKQHEMIDGRIYYSLRCKKCNQEIGYKMYDPVSS